MTTIRDLAAELGTTADVIYNFGDLDYRTTPEDAPLDAADVDAIREAWANSPDN
ncbi:hypothetical protein [Melissospora conviva]|uniref:hypothetical protein n=1 Tax=Melissospora conviva TaxID=3388432 RepID=UPI003C191A07